MYLPERLKQWTKIFKASFKRNRWWLLICIPIDLIFEAVWHYMMGSLNDFVISHHWLSSVLLRIFMVILGTCALVILILIIHAYVETRPREKGESRGDDDPRVVIRVENPKPDPEGLTGEVECPIYLNNRGKCDAYRVQIEPIRLAGNEAVFPVFALLGFDKEIRAKAAIMCDGKPVDRFLERKVDLELIFAAECDGSKRTEISVPFAIGYEDHRRNKFQTTGFFDYKARGPQLSVRDFEFKTV